MARVRTTYRNREPLLVEESESSSDPTIEEESSAAQTRADRFELRRSLKNRKETDDQSTTAESITPYTEAEEEPAALTDYLSLESLSFTDLLTTHWDLQENLWFGTGAVNEFSGSSLNDIAYGLDAPDVLSGGGGSDLLVGGKQDDTLRGGNQNDVLLGEEGNDQLEGGGGDDLLIGGSGQDRLDGGSGIDTAVFLGPFSDYEISVADNELIVTARSAPEQPETLKDIEFLQFDDQTVAASVYLAGTPILEVPGEITPEEGETSFQLDIVASLTDSSGTEALTIYVAGLPEGAVLSAGTTDEDGSWALLPEELSGLTITMPPSWVPSSFSLVVTAIATVLATGATAQAMEKLPFGTAQNDFSIELPSLEPEPSNGGVQLYAGWGSTTLTGTDGNDVIEAETKGEKTMVGGDGDDAYLFTGSDVEGHVEEGVNGGTDTIYMGVGWVYDLADNVENIVLQGISSGQVNGNELDNILYGSEGDNNLNGNGGDDILVGGAGSDALDGGSGNDTAYYNDSQEFYNITYESDGTISVTSTYVTSESDTLTSIETIQFTDGQIVVAEVDPADTSPPEESSDPDPDSEPNPDTPQTTVASTENISGQVIYQAPDAQSVGAIVGLTIENSTSSTVPSDYKTFGHVFVEGDVPAGSGLVMLIDGQSIAVQMDVKATWDDGSVRHAILTVDMPSLGSEETVDAFLTLGEEPAGSALSPTSIVNGGLDLAVTLQFDNSSGVQQSAKTYDVGELFEQAYQSGDLTTWMEGPLAAEYSFEQMTPEGLELRFDIRVFADGDIRADVTFANEHTYTESVTLTYDAVIRKDGVVVQTESNLEHYRNSNWHTQIWDGEESGSFVKFDIDYMAETGAIPHYDTSLGITGSLLDDGIDADFGPMGNGNILKYMPATGGRVDIGILPEWTTNYLISQNEVAFELMMANGDAAGSVPWHFVDEATGEYVSLVDHPGLWLDGRQTSGEDALTTQFSSPDGWALDSAHHPSLSFIPYLVSGDQYHLDNMLAAATFQLGRVGVREREADGGLFVDRLAYQQVRGSAWALRTISEVAFLSPDDNSLTAEIQKMLEDNLDYLVKHYITEGYFDAAGDLEGFFESYDLLGTNAEFGRVSPWMNDYFVGVLGVLAGQGYEQAAQLVEWTSSFTVGRYVNEENGWDPTFGSSYRIRVIDPETGEYNTNWADAFQDTEEFGGLHSGYAYSADSFTAIGFSAISSTVTVTGDVEAIEAFGFIFQHAYENGAYDPGAAKGYYGNGQWQFMPKMSDGSYLLAANMHVSGGNVSGTSANELIYGLDSSDSISGQGGVDWLFGGAGNDTVRGDSGNDVLFGNDGNDFLIGGSGDDMLSGGTGADTFVFESASFGHDTIHDFDFELDSIEISNGQIDSLSDLIAAATSHGGDVILDLGNGNTITLEDVSLSDLSSLDLILG